MKNLSIILVFATLLNFGFAQEAGEIFNNNELLKLFGEVKQSVDFKTEELKNLIPLAGEHIMFRIISDDVVILDQHRQQLYPYDKDADYDEKTVFKFFSVSVLNRLLQSADYHKVIFEEREKALVVKYKNKSMERGRQCPPYCPKEGYADNFRYLNIYMVNAVN
ncbi:MAG: hypothetical protein ACEPO8_13450 [Rhodothermaceae bacterium]